MKPKMTFFILLILLLLTMAGSIGGLYLSNQKLAKNGQDLSSKESLVKAADNRLFHLKGLAIKTKKAESALGDIDAVFPEDKLQSEFIDQISKLAKDKKVNIGSDISFPGGSEAPSRSTQTTPSGIVPVLIGMKVTLPVSGSYSDVMSFIKSLENFNRLTNIEGLSLNSQDQGKNVDGTIDILVLVNQKSAVPAAGAAGAKDSKSSPKSSTSNSKPQSSSQSNGKTAQ
ncbi:type 4a pilus biogenesis protein PilO [Candidatus Saccharibacteria bacterium]|nr:type 4a pilus biogenesis protein PilO [Candidatus Saccharibacteria bacterium]MBP9131559.1 type 4a pilus biogenesis protein PilO [Candidatus Saccharibacteria bacterium]